MDVHDLTAAYALDALEPAEAEAYEAHLGQCEECRAQLAELNEAATALAFPGRTERRQDRRAVPGRDHGDPGPRRRPRPGR